LKRKFKTYLENELCIYRGSSAGDAIDMLRIMSKRTLDMEAYAFFTDWPKAFDSGKWSKLKKSVID
jgi:hypothetical protein